MAWFRQLTPNFDGRLKSACVFVSVDMECPGLLVIDMVNDFLAKWAAAPTVTKPQVTFLSTCAR
jgi:hypothetical protein